ncbi:MAG TPA: GNAT family N-acetyltransferase [Vicinamibacterales bacterium]|nr:GNAT family N-acetyltransferase [Vicinamibacterales bacterium]
MIRHATEADLDDILAIYNHAIEYTTAVFEYRPHTIEMRREWLRAKQAASLPVLAAVDSGRVVGFASYGPFRAWPAYKYSVELSVYVDVNARGRGVGTSLVRAILDDARAHEIHVVMAGITADNDVSLRLHQRLGFVEVAHIPQVGYKFGQWLDLKFLQRMMDGPLRPSEP